MGKKGNDERVTEYDKEYTKKLSDIAERQQQMAEEQWQLYKDHFQQYEIDAARTNRELLPYISNATRSLMTEAIEGIDTTRRQDEAEADVVAGFEKSEQAMKMEADKYGLDPSSHRRLGMFKNMGLEKSKAIAGARTGARERADTEKFNRLAVVSGKQPLPTANVAGRAMTGMGMASSSYRPLATRVMRTEFRDNSNIWDFVGDVGSTVAGAYVGSKMFGPKRRTE